MAARAGGVGLRALRKVRKMRSETLNVTRDSTMSLQTISRTELARKTREVLTAVREGRPAVVESYGEEQAVVMDALDYRLLLGVVAWAVTPREERLAQELKPSRAVSDYLDERISLGKTAEHLGISRFELMERFERLGVPLRLGPLSLEEAQDEVRVALRASARP